MNKFMLYCKFSVKNYNNIELEPFKSASYDVEIQKLLKQLMEQIVQFDSPAAIQTIQSIETRLNVDIRYEKKENA